MESGGTKFDWLSCAPRKLVPGVTAWLGVIAAFPVRCSGMAAPACFGGPLSSPGSGFSRTFGPIRSAWASDGVPASPSGSVASPSGSVSSPPASSFSASRFPSGIAGAECSRSKSPLASFATLSVLPLDPVTGFPLMVSASCRLPLPHPIPTRASSARTKSTAALTRRFIGCRV